MLAEIIAVLIVVVVLTAMVSRYRHWGRHTGRRRELAATPIKPPLDTDLDVALERGLVDIARGTPTDGIVDCWLRVEAAAEAAGAEVHAADTADEFAARVAATFGLPLGALSRLASLYREARFSTHITTEQARVEAEQCLRDIQRDLHARR